MDDLPTKNSKDHLHKATKAVLSIVPLVGGALVELLDTVFSAPIDKRKEEWLIKLAETVNELCTKVEGLTPEKLQNNPEFISFSLQASNIALRTHNKEKLKALNSTVKNCILLQDINESKKMIFLRILDEITPLHFKIFDFLSNYPKHLEDFNNKSSGFQQNIALTMSRGKIYDVWHFIHNDIPADDPLIDIVISDLKNYGFLDKNFNMSTTGSSHNQFGTNKSFVTIFGKDFIRFISE
jgi:hypothetical protein